jgi:hypothetical protein
MRVVFNFSGAGMQGYALRSGEERRAVFAARLQRDSDKVIEAYFAVTLQPLLVSVGGGLNPACRRGNVGVVHRQSPVATALQAQCIGTAGC